MWPVASVAASVTLELHNREQRQTGFAQAARTAKLGQVLCSDVCEVTADEVRRFRSLLGYAAAGDASLAPTSMGLTYGLRLGWEHSIFPPGVVRMGDDDVFGVPAQLVAAPGQRL